MRVSRRPAVWLAALLALLVGMALLPSAGAAESAAERLGADGTREFAGADRYETAVLLAQAVVNARPVNSAIVASGESLVDATAAASLAAVQGSVVLLTRPGHLPASVAEFIEAAGLSEVTIVGGPAAVSAGVEAQLGALNGVSSVARVSGADRYATSAAIAAESEVPGAFCGIERSVFLVGGSSLVDAIAAGPYAYAMGMPILFTEAGGLPSAVSSYLRDADIQRAVVVGDLDAVSTAVDGQLRDAGIVHSWRIDGPDAPTRAVDLLKAVATCSETTISPDTVALVDGTVPIDGTTAAAVLGTGLGVPNTVVPALVVGETLPAVVRHYLAPNPPSGDPPAYEHVNLLPLGGTARLTPELLAETIKAAITELPPTVTFTRYFHYPPIAHLGRTSCLIGDYTYLATFSTDVLEVDAYDINNYTLNGEHLGHGRVIHKASPRQYYIELGNIPGTTISMGVRPNGIRTKDGKSVSNKEMTSFSRLPSAPKFPKPMAYATVLDGGRQFMIMTVGGTHRHISLGADKNDYLNRSEVTVTIDGQDHPLTDTSIFDDNSAVLGTGTCGGQGGWSSGEELRPETGLTLKLGDTLTIEAGAIIGPTGLTNEEITIPFEFRSEFRTHPLARGRIRYLDDVSSNQNPKATVTLTPFANYPPLLHYGHLRCINPSNSFHAKFSRPVNTVDASTQSSYSLEVDGTDIGAATSGGVFSWADVEGPNTFRRGNIGVSGIRISDSAVHFRLNLADEGQISINPGAIRTLDGGTVETGSIEVKPFGNVGSIDIDPTIFAYTHDDGRMLTILGVGRFQGTRHRMESIMRLDAPGVDRDLAPFKAGFDRVAECQANNIRYNLRCDDEDWPGNIGWGDWRAYCGTRDGTWFMTLRAVTSYFAPGDELVWRAGDLSDGRGSLHPEIRVTIESFDELQANAPDLLALSQ